MDHREVTPLPLQGSTRLPEHPRLLARSGHIHADEGLDEPHTGRCALYADLVLGVVALVQPNGLQLLMLVLVVPAVDFVASTHMSGLSEQAQGKHTSNNSHRRTQMIHLRSHGYQRRGGRARRSLQRRQTTRATALPRHHRNHYVAHQARGRASSVATFQRTRSR